MDETNWAARYCPACNASLVNRFVTASGVVTCAQCGERQTDRLGDLERRVANIEQARQLDAFARDIKRDRTAAWMGLPALEERIEQLEKQASYCHHIPVSGPLSWASVLERLDALEQGKGRRR